MREQQYASAWPYLEWQSVYNQEDGYSLFVSNNGVGPAIIKNVEIMFDGQQMDNLKSVYDRILETSEYPYLSARVANRVIPAGDQIRLMQINDPMMSELAYYRLDTADFRFRICYESIYGEGWTSSGHEVEVSSCPWLISEAVPVNVIPEYTRCLFRGRFLLQVLPELPDQ